MSLEPVGEVVIRPSGCRWTIGFFSTFLKKKEYNVSSPVFRFRHQSWHFRLRPNGYALEPNNVTIWIYRKGPAELDVRHKWEIAVKDIKDKTHCRISGERAIDKNLKHWACHCGGLLLSEQELKDKKLLAHGKLRLQCTMEFDGPSASSGPMKKKPSDPMLSSDDEKFKDPRVSYRELLKIDESKDLNLKVGGRYFRAHRILLENTCQNFSAVSERNVNQGDSDKLLVIDECDPEAFQEFLNGLYTEHLENVTAENVFGIYAAADMFGVVQLMEECLFHMETFLTVGTFCETLALALRHPEAELLKVATRFFSKNEEAIKVTEKWQRFSDEKPKVAEEFLAAAVQLRGS